MNPLSEVFRTCAIEAFTFLEADFGYISSLSTAGVMHVALYESPAVYVSVAFEEARGFEVSVGIGQREPANSPEFDLEELLRCVDAPEESTACYMASSAQRLTAGLKELAGSLQTYGAAFLRDEDGAFERLRLHRESECTAYAREDELRRARTDAEAAWQAKDHAAVIKALAPVRGSLTASDVGKLEYSQRQLRQGMRRD